MRKLKALTAAAAAILLPSICFGLDNGADRRDIINRNYDIFTSVVTYVDANYVDSLPLQKMFEGAIEGFLEPLDPYTTFFSEKEAKEFLQSSKGEYGGIGSYLMKIGDYIVINNPTEGSPAILAGLRSGDKILRIDTVDAKGISMEEARSHLLGMPGTELTLRVCRPYVGADSILDFKLERAKLVTPTVPYYGVDNDGIGYLQLTQFGDNSAAEVREAIKRMLADKTMKGLIVDLSDNGGGRLEAAIEILELFVPKGTTVLSTKGRTKEKDYITSQAPIVPADMPVAVLINGSSASASEVTAGALQDLDRAVLVGSKSYGKGLVQSTMPTPYNTMVKVTTSKYYIPSGRLIQAYDYSRRNPDGSIAHVPDSLARAFKTKAGRTVYDGGGLSPDSVVDYPDATPVLYALATDNAFFDYANKYAATHDTIVSPRDFRITDEIFADFKSGLPSRNLKYNGELEELVSDLREKITDSGYLDKDVEARLAALEEVLRHDLDRDVDSSRALIEMLLAPEIISRYYNTRGHVINSLNYDPRFKAAKAILLDKPLYDSMLSAPKAEKSKADKNKDGKNRTSKPRTPKKKG